MPANRADMADYNVFEVILTAGINNAPVEGAAGNFMYRQA
jgi:hypothetical protein